MTKKTPEPLNMQTYLRLEIQRLRELGYAFPEDLVNLLNKRAKYLDKQIMADRTRRAYSNSGGN